MFHNLNINEIYFNYEQKLGALFKESTFIKNNFLCNCIFKKHIQLVFVCFYAG